MPYCPTCNREYRRGKSRCPDCGVPLIDAPWESAVVDSSHVSSEPSGDLHLQVIYSSGSEVDLRRAKAFLKAEGIECLIRWATTWPEAIYVVGDAFLGMWGGTLSRRGGQVVVNAEDAGRATELLESLEPVPADDGVSEDED